MPAGKRKQSNPWLAAAVVFIILFLVVLVVAVPLYLSLEKQRTIANDAVNELKAIADSREQANKDKDIGAKLKGKTYLGTTLTYIDNMTSLVLGGAPDDELSAALKIENTNKAIEEAILALKPYVEFPDSRIKEAGLLKLIQDKGLIRIIEELKAQIDRTTEANAAYAEAIRNLQNQFDDAAATNFAKEDQLLELKAKDEQRVLKVTNDYAQLGDTVEKNAKQAIADLTSQLDEEEAKSKDLYMQVLKAQAELDTAQQRIASVKNQIDLITKPNSAVAAYKPDGKIIVINNNAKVVHLNIGSEVGVYRGLTFQVYDKAVPIPENGKGKAEIEVFDVQRNISIAKIKYADHTKPILLNDVIGNVVWSSEKPNTFVIAGDFDFDNNGSIDFNGTEKIAALIEGWGGKVSLDVSVDSDFVVLGSKPQVLPEPTFEQKEIDPMATKNYEASLERAARYEQIEKRANLLSVPIFNLERFLYLIGYKSYVDKTGTL